ncbi:MAG TPA: beta-propeller fold lactonase family protein [Gemmatimonadaceae bacterium]|jgi:6-phosphogluconolactonase (cycloisomerase 2 family)|nr:beta-propeller fold lactonase family protein [Gemmatimonadaceae bacterium]
MRLVRILAALSLAACGTRDTTSPPLSGSAALDRVGAAAVGAVYTQTNDASANAVRAFARASDGSLTFVADYPTGGKGNGAPGLGSQGAVIIAEERFLLAVNAGSNEISSFRIGASGLTLVETISSGGTMPVSVSSWGGLVYVLNAGSDNVTGFRLNSVGDLSAIPGSTRSLSGTGTGAAQVGFHPRGRQVVVTEKATNSIDVFAVNANGTLTGPAVQPSNGATPFGFEFSQRGYLLVSEAFGGAPNASATSSYGLSDAGALLTLSKSVPTTETAACWVVVTSDQRFVYVTNTGSNTITGYALAPNGTLRRLSDDGVTAQTQTGPIDADFSRDGQFLYTLDRGSGAISIFGVNANGSLTSRGTQSGIPTTAYGLVAR